MEPLLIQEDIIPNGGRCGVLEPDRAGGELLLANASINSMPEIVVAALLNRSKPSITLVLDLMFRWSGS
jgi:hypothetical protein